MRNRRADKKGSMRSAENIKVKKYFILMRFVSGACSLKDYEKNSNTKVRPIIRLRKHNKLIQKVISTQYSNSDTCKIRYGLQKTGIKAETKKGITSTADMQV